MNMQVIEKPVLGVSSCLTGQAVRFDGGHKAFRLLNDHWKHVFEVKTACPEVELGLGVPRPAIQLREVAGDVRLVFSRDPNRDLTGLMQQHAIQRIRQMGPMDGYIFKKDSPSCGVSRVAVLHEDTGQKTRDGTGLFARVFSEMNPLVPVEDEGRLQDARLRDNFLQRVYCLYRWRMIEDADNNLQAFYDFHRRHKFMLMARDQNAYRALGRQVANTTSQNLAESRQVYIEQFMRVMQQCPTPGQHVNVLLHILGYFKPLLNAYDKAEMINWFDAYRHDRVKHMTPLALLRHYLRLHPNAYIEQQYYLEPYPDYLLHAA